MVAIAEVTPVARQVIGTGIRAPFSFSVGKTVRAVSTSAGLAKIIASIRDILLTRPGERINQPEYGSRLWDLLFEPIDPITTQLLNFYTAEALRRWEPRIAVTSADFLEDDSNPNFLGIKINFTVLATHEEGSFVFPFERTGMPMAQAVTGVESERIFQQGTVASLTDPGFLNIGTLSAAENPTPR